MPIWPVPMRSAATVATGASWPHAASAPVSQSGRQLGDVVDDRVHASGRPGLAGAPVNRSGRAARYAGRIGSSSAGVAPCRITPLAPRSNWSQDRRRALLGRARRGGGESTRPGGARRAARARRSSPWRRSRRRKPCTNGSARKRASTAGIPVVHPHEQVAVALEVGGQPSDRSSSDAARRRCGRRRWRAPTRCAPSRGRVRPARHRAGRRRPRSPSRRR